VLGREYDFNMPQMMAVGLVIGVAAGLLNGFIVSSLNVYPLLPTLATMFAFRGVALVIGRGTGRNMPMFWNRIISARWGPLPIHVFVAFGLAIGVQLLLNNTKTGRHIYALGDSEKTSHEKGINARRIKILVYAVSGLMCAVASIIFTAQTMGLPPSSAVGIEFKCVTAAVLGGVSLFGGKGTVAPGVIIGSLLMSIISNVLVIMNASVYMYTIVYAVVILFVVLLETLKIRKLTSV
ncbi:MAG: ABC transporter permease, partial [Defluviitaleaceae bacterium]|nr:ABC transporter permease [Defluviitaleaceae bacterium]